MEENKVVLSLGEYLRMLNEIDSANESMEEMRINYQIMKHYIKKKVYDRTNYEMQAVNENIIEGTINDKMSDYHYKYIVDEFLKIGITFDFAIELTDELIIDKHNENIEEGD